MGRDVKSELARWEETYGILFGKVPRLSGLSVPPPPAGIDSRLIVTAWELMLWTSNRPHEGLLKAMSRHFRCSDGFVGQMEEVLISKRHPHCGTSAVWVRDGLEADQEFANYSLDELARTQHQGITALERLLLEADNYVERSLHLDLDTVTVCAGSRAYGRSAVCCDWSGDRLHVFYSSSNKASSRRRSRQVWN